MTSVPTLRGLTCLLLAALGSATCPAQSMFRGDAGHSGVSASAAPRTLPHVKWTFPTSDRIVSSPVWSAGTLYFGGDDGHLYAVDAGTGRQRWKFATGGPVASTPAIASGVVYFGSYDGKFYALDAQSGELRWKFATHGERRFEAKGLHGMQPKAQTFADPLDIFLSSPVVALGAVYFGSGDGHVYALDAASGELKWRFATGDVVHASPAFADGAIYVGSWDSHLYAIDARTGREQWRFKSGEDPVLHNQVGFQSSPAVVDGVVYVGCRDSNLYAIDARTGTEKWRFSTGLSWVITSPAVRDGKVYFATSDSSLVHIVDASTGKPIAERPAKAYMFSSPVLAGSVVLIAALNGMLEARDSASAELLWTYRTPASSENRGWVLTADGRFNAPIVYRSPWRESPILATERQLSVGSIFSTPLVVNGVVYFGSTDGRLYALE